MDSQSESVWKARDTWTITTSGELQGALEGDEGEDLLSVDSIAVWARAVYRKSGRSGVIFSRIETGTHRW